MFSLQVMVVSANNPCYGWQCTGLMVGEQVTLKYSRLKICIKMCTSKLRSVSNECCPNCVKPNHAFA